MYIVCICISYHHAQATLKIGGSWSILAHVVAGLMAKCKTTRPMFDEINQEHKSSDEGQWAY